MSSMLEQAIIDAGALKEAAIKNAETSIIEKYSTEIKFEDVPIIEYYANDIGNWYSIVFDLTIDKQPHLSWDHPMFVYS